MGTISYRISKNLLCRSYRASSSFCYVEASSCSSQYYIKKAINYFSHFTRVAGRMQTRLFSLFKSFKSKKDANISSIRQLVSPFLIKVHPDTLSSVKNVEKQVNGSSLQRFNAFLDELENGCNHGNVSTTIDKHVLLEFYLPFRKGKESKVSFAFRTPIGLMDNSISTQTTNERIREWKKFSNKVIVTVHKVAGLPSPATLPIGDSRYQVSYAWTNMYFILVCRIHIGSK